MESVTESENIRYKSSSKFLDANDLASYWFKKLKLDNSCRSKCKQYADILVSKMRSWIEIHSHLKTSFNVYLQIDILREVFQENRSLNYSWDFEGCKEYLKSNKEQPKLPENLNIIELFKIFMENAQILAGFKKIAIDHPPLDEKLEEWLNCHRFFAIEEIFGRAARIAFPSYQPRMRNQRPNSNFIDAVENDFHYIEVANYFVADLFLKELQCNSAEGRFQSLLVDQIFSQPQRKVIRAFLDNGLQNILSTIPRNVFYRCQTSLFEVNYNKEYMPCIIFLLAEEGCATTLQLLFDCINFKKSTNEPTWFSLSHRFQMKDYMFDACQSILFNRLTMLQFLSHLKGVNIVDEGGKTPLHYAAKGGHLDTVKFLVENGADVNCMEYFNNFMPLHFAAVGGYLDVVKYLVEHGAHTNGDYRNKSHREYAAKLSDIGVTRRYRIEYKSLISDSRCGFMHPIQHVVSRRDSEMARFLVEKGADVLVDDEEKNTLLHLALQRGCSDLAQFLVENGVKVSKKNSQGTTALHLADTMTLAECLIARGADVNVRDDEDRTPMYFAVLSNKLDVAEVFLKNGSSLNTINKDGSTALRTAVAERKHDAVKFLLKHGADFNLRKPGDCTLLHVAVLKGDLDIVVDLVRSGIYLNVKDSGNCTALHLALKNGQLDAVRCLVEHGADVSITDDDGHTALDLAVMNDYLDIVKLVVNHSGKNVCYYPALHKAVCLSRIDITKYLLEIDPDVNRRNKKGWTVLHFATNSKLELVRLLVEHGANVNLKNDDGRTPLHLAVLQGRLDIVEFLAEYSEVRADDNEGCNALHLAVKQRFLNIVEFLLKHIDVDVVDAKGCTALYLAAENGKLDMLKLLLKRTKDVNIKNKVGRTALHVSAVRGDLDIIKIFLEFGADINSKDNTGSTALHLAASGHSLDVFKFLAQSTGDVSLKDNNGNTVLHIAAKKGDLSVLRFILERVDDVNVVNNDGQMALHLVAAGGSTDLHSTPVEPSEATGNARMQERVKLLMEFGANAALTDCLGNIPLHIAAMSGEIDVVKLLVKCVDAGVKNKKGYTAFQLAVYNFHIEVVEYLSGIDGNLTGPEHADFLRYLTLETNMELELRTGGCNSMFL